MKALEHLDNIIKSRGNNSSEWRHLINELRNDDNKYKIILIKIFIIIAMNYF